ncbi:MAG: adenosine deaminase [Pseudomonadota bacterium]
MIKAELHCHIEGAAEPDLVLRLARKYGLDMSDVIREGRYVWHDFTSFLNAYDKASTALRAPEDYRLLTYEYYTALADQGAIYGEVFGSSDHAALMGIGYEELVEAISDGIDDATRDCGIEGRIIMTCVRHLGPESAEKVAQLVTQNPHPKVTGFGMGGDERMFTPLDFAPAFDIAGNAGLGLTCHAGEFGGAQSVRDCLDHLNVTRVGHGVRSVEDPELVERLVDEDIVLEVCPESNIALQVFPDERSHPLAQLRDAGVRLTLNSDDPPFFHTSLSNDYAFAETHCGFDDEALLQCTRTALEAAFVDDATRAKLMRKLPG